MECHQRGWLVYTRLKGDFLVVSYVAAQYAILFAVLLVLLWFVLSVDVSDCYGSS
ncbi:hypothetical protein SAMN02745752_00434 [Marinospirillum alkaliphilum DSM 21637]|uniref:Uncharacterized protein n=1 Tax=Marinospirillum alkaliphilum DSM 21637 TaxID=1122209 RepID=A0A1K1U4U1_9GAMM|nr:hypothetical protein SAMN02745752_00434 [Marinospirillum alkaliphilum DSM 21637]